MKKIISIFLVSFFLNLIWENIHSSLYTSYKSGAISEFILLRASIADAIIITLICLPFLFIATWRNKRWLILPLGIMIGIAIELYALQTARWSYNNRMPIIPIISVGLTPAIQLGLLGYLAYWLVEHFQGWRIRATDT